MNARLLTIGGFDPTGGAGILADIKTFQTHRCEGFSILTSNTIQTEDKFISNYWVSESQIFEQLECLLKYYKFDGIKISLVESTEILVRILNFLHHQSKKSYIIWDPILTASTGFNFHENFKEIPLFLEHIDIVIPNHEEMKKMSGNSDIYKIAEQWSYESKVYLKGGHHPEKKGLDTLFSEGKSQNFRVKGDGYFEKHGSGCVFSASLLANICKGYRMNKSALRSKRYIEKFLKSSKKLLGKHY